MSVLQLTRERGLRLSASWPWWSGAALVFIAAFLLFTPSFGAYFAVLDFNHLQAIHFTKASTFFLRILDPSDGGRDIIGTGDLYRPTYYGVYWLEYQLFGFHPEPYYIFNTALHATNAVLVWLLAWRITRSQLASTAGALVWAFHPQYADTVAWISSTTDLLLVFFGVGALLLYSVAQDATGARRWTLVGASVASALLSLGAKESGIAVIGIIIGYHLFIHTPVRLDTSASPWKLHIDRSAIPWTLLPFLLVLAIYIPLRFALVGNLAENNDHSFLSARFFSNIHVFSGLAAGPLVWQKYPQSYFGVGQGIAGMLVTAGTVAAFIFGSRRERFFAGWFYVALVPYLVLHPVWIVGRYLYLPNIGLALLAGCGIARAIDLLPAERFGAYVRPLAAAALLTGIAVWFAIISFAFQENLTEKGDQSRAFLQSLHATYPDIPSGSRLIVSESPRSLSLAEDDAYMLRPAVAMTYGRKIDVVTPRQIADGEAPPATSSDLWYPPR